MPEDEFADVEPVIEEIILLEDKKGFIFYRKRRNIIRR